MQKHFGLVGNTIKVKCKDKNSECYPWQDVTVVCKRVEVARVPVFVWPMPTQDGCFIVEHQDGRCQKVQPDSLTFLGSKELFDQYSWEEA